MRLTDPTTVPEADLCLRFALAGLHRAQAVAGQLHNGHTYVALARQRIDRFLELRMELVRAEADGRVEEVWCGSWPGTAAPQWPQSEAVVS